MAVSAEVDQAISDNRVRLVPGPEMHGGLANAIARAWRDRTFRDRLLSFPTGSTAGISPADYERTKQALIDEGVNLPDAVVLTEDQFAELVQLEAYEKRGPYRGIRSTDVVLVLREPEPRRIAANDVRAAMLASTAGV
jgi:hypothetical protein